MLRRLVPAVILGTVLATGCASQTTRVPPVVPALPQAYELRWVEPYPATGPGLVFGVRSFEVTADGWSAQISVENRTGVPWELPDEAESYRRSFGVMMFTTGELSEVDRRNRDGDLPTARAAARFEPALTTFLAAGATWSGTLSAPGPLPSGRFVRLAFGPFEAVGDPPEGLERSVVWITDHAVELR